MWSYYLLKQYSHLLLLPLKRTAPQWFPAAWFIGNNNGLPPFLAQIFTYSSSCQIHPASCCKGNNQFNLPCRIGIHLLSSTDAVSFVSLEQPVKITINSNKAEKTLDKTFLIFFPPILYVYENSICSPVSWMIRFFVRFINMMEMIIKNPANRSNVRDIGLWKKSTHFLMIFPVIE